MRKLLTLITLPVLALSIMAQTKIGGTAKVGGTAAVSTATPPPCSFPCESILDNFNRANEGPPPSANWTTGIDGGTGSFTVTSNVARLTSGAFSSAWWNVGNIGPDLEVFAVIASVGGSRLYFHVQGEGTATFDGYYVQAYAPSSEMGVFRVDNGVPTQLEASISQAIATGDSIGVDRTGNVITVYFCASGAGCGASGAGWTNKGTRSDSTYTSAGKIGMAAFDNSEVKFDDFGGGTK